MGSCVFGILYSLSIPVANALVGLEAGFNGSVRRDGDKAVAGRMIEQLVTIGRGLRQRPLRRIVHELHCGLAILLGRMALRELCTVLCNVGCCFVVRRIVCKVSEPDVFCADF